MGWNIWHTHTHTPLCLLFIAFTWGKKEKKNLNSFVICYPLPLQNRPNLTSQGFLVWSVEKMTDWTVKPVCFALSEQGGQCYSKLTLIVYSKSTALSFWHAWSTLQADMPTPLHRASRQSIHHISKSQWVTVWEWSVYSTVPRYRGCACWKRPRDLLQRGENAGSDAL